MERERDIKESIFLNSLHPHEKTEINKQTNKKKNGKRRKGEVKCYPHQFGRKVNGSLSSLLCKFVVVTLKA